MSRTIYGAPAAPSDRLLTAGETTLPRTQLITAATGVTPTLNTGRLLLTGFTARRSETINSLAMWAQTFAAATPTLVRYCVYTVNADGSLSLTASTPNDTTLLATAQTRQSKALSAPWQKQADTRYAAGALVVTAAAAPAVFGLTASSPIFQASEPRLGYRLNSQTDLPASISVASLDTTSSALVYVEMLP